MRESESLLTETQIVSLARARQALRQVDRDVIRVFGYQRESLGDSFSPLMMDARAGGGPGAINTSSNASRFGRTVATVTGDCVRGYAQIAVSSTLFSEQLAQLSAGLAASNVRQGILEATLSETKAALSETKSLLGVTRNALKEVAHPGFALASGQVVAELRAQ